jgi:acetoin utilization deacetylase AcuC-like enzyme
MTTGWVWDERCLWHDTGRYAGVRPPGPWLEPHVHLENAEVKRRMRSLVEVSGLLAQLTPIAARAATVAEVCRFHDPAYVERIRTLSAGDGGDAGNATPFGHGSFELALLSAGGIIAAVDAVLDETVDNAYALVRPPGHHALPDCGMGFCIFGNVAIAVMHARRVRGVGRVAVVDWDVHHGNGTQVAFYEDPDVLTISIHQSGGFPHGSGRLEETGAGAGAGANLNIPLPPGCGTGAYVAAFERVVVSALRRFGPELIVVASGFDAAGMDPLGRMMLHSDSYRQLTRLVMDAAADCCAGRVVCAHEGGYSAHLSPLCGHAVVETLAGVRTAVEDPFVEHIAGSDGQELAPHQAEAVERAAGLVDRVPRRPR